MLQLMPEGRRGALSGLLIPPPPLLLSLRTENAHGS